jgi:hypothetical protein
VSNPSTCASAFDRLASISSTRFCSVAIVVTEEDIASSFEEFQFNDLFFFFGTLRPSVQDILASSPPQPSSQALSPQNHPGKSCHLPKM